MEGDDLPLWGLVGLRCVAVPSQLQLMEKWSLAFLVSPPGSQSCLALAPALAFELIHVLLRLQRAQGGNSLSTTWSSEVEGKAPREEFHSLKSRMCSWCYWKNSLMQQLCSVLSRDSRHSIRSHVILALGLIPNECSVVNALSATFALKGKSLVLRNFPHPVALFFLRGVIIAESKIQTCVSLGT